MRPKQQTNATEAKASTAVLFDDVYGVVAEEDMGHIHEELFAELERAGLNERS